jgi:hypothetical protein
LVGAVSGTLPLVVATAVAQFGSLAELVATQELPPVVPGPV